MLKLIMRELLVGNRSIVRIEWEIGCSRGNKLGINPEKCQKSQKNPWPRKKNI
jgi:hypothetical protein